MMNEVRRPSVEDFKRLYEKADQYTKEVALIGGEAVIPAHNELRNAGCHLQRALGAGGCIEQEDELRKGIGHCQRALYEASESGITVLLEMLRSFDEDYKGLNIGSVIPGIRDIRALRREAQAVLSSTRPNSKEAPAETDKYMELFRNLKAGIDLLEDNRSDLDAERDKEQERRDQHNHRWQQTKIEEKNRTIQWLSGIIVTILLALIGMIFQYVIS